MFTDADHTKLNGIEASADVTDTANVTSAGALMTIGGTISGNLLTLTGDLNGSGHVKSEGPDGGSDYEVVDAKLQLRKPRDKWNVRFRVYHHQQW